MHADVVVLLYSCGTFPHPKGHALNLLQLGKLAARVTRLGSIPWTGCSGKTKVGKEGGEHESG